MSDILDIDNENDKFLAITDAETRIQKASALQFMTQTEGWKILLAAFEDMAEDQLEELGRHRPGDDKQILAAHSVWYSVLHTLENIKTAVSSAIQDGEAAKVELAQLTHPLDED